MTTDPVPPKESGSSAYDRAAASRIIAEPLPGGVFTSTRPEPRTIRYRSQPMTPDPDSHLTLAQRRYLSRFMQPCKPEQVTSASDRITWTDSDGIPNTAHISPTGFGPILPIAAREAVLALWHQLENDTTLVAAIGHLGDEQRGILTATTTDIEPLKILRTGVEATSRVLVQHALLAHQTPYDTPVEFASGLRRSGIFATVAGTWFWELQASTFRRGMIPVTLVSQDNATVRYSTSPYKPSA